MAYIGVARPVIAKYGETDGNVTYSEGFRFGKAIKVGISPSYEDVSEYGGINDTDEEQEFAYADITLETSDTPIEAETMLYGHDSQGDEVISRTEDRANYVGMGIRVKETVSGRKLYSAVWIHKVKFSDGEQEHETKGDSIRYGTPEIKGKAVPDCNGKWRTKRRFQSKEDADKWLDNMAQIEGGNEMAYVGFRKPIVAKMTGEKTYDEPFAFGKAVGLQVTPNYAEGSLNADDEQAEYDKEFNYAEVTLNTSTIPIIAHEKMFGHTIDEEMNGVTFNKDDQANYVGFGWISVEKVNGKRSFIGNFLYKAKFSEPAEDYATKADAIEYKTPSITGRASTAENGDWKDTKSFNTVQEALDWVYEKFGTTLKALTIQSAASATDAGKTKITVTEQKDETNTYFYKTGESVTQPAYNEVCNTATGWKTWEGTAEMTANTGDKIVIVEATTEGNYARKAGETTVTAKASLSAKEDK